MKFNNVSIKRKLVLLQIFTAFIVLILTATAFVVYDIAVFREALIERLSSIAFIIGENSLSAVQFLDEEVAASTLSSLSIDRHIVNAAIYDGNGDIFVKYGLAGFESFEFPDITNDSYEIIDGYLILFKNVVRNQEVVSTVYLRTDMTELRENIFGYIRYALLLLTVGIFMSLILSAFLQRTISRPILHLVDATRDISSTGDYSRRVRKVGDDELGALYEGFNEMLEQIQERDTSLREAKNSLEERVKDRTQQLNKALIEAQAANRTKSSFLANMSHEIRTPLNVVIGMTQLALDTPLTVKQHDYMEKVDTSAKSLLRIIDDILDFSKIEAGMLNLESAEFDLEKVLENISHMMSIKAEQKGLELIFSVESDVPTQLKGDSLRLSQVLLNLTNNAIKFTNEGFILVKITKEYEEGDRVRLHFSIKDTGIGIVREELSDLFNPFTQADVSTTRKFGGTGLGLSISKSIVELMGGTMTVQSEHGKGSTFGLNAVFEKHEGIRGERVILPVELKGMHVLVVDDNNVARETLSKSLESMSIDVFAVASGEEAIAELDGAVKGGRPFEITFLDWKMPGIDGIETAKRIKDMKNISETHSVIMVTAYSKGEIIEQAREVGIKSYLIKPVSQSKLFDTIMEVLGKQYVQRGGQKEAGKKLSVDVSQVKGARLLLVEDNELNQEVAQELLESAGFNVTIAQNGLAAVEMISAEFDLVLMDIQMPEMDGYEATKTIRNNPLFRELPIIAMTANVMQTDLDKCLEAGMNDHVSKPINSSELFNTINKWAVAREVPGSSVAVAPTSTINIEQDPVPELSGIDVERGLARVGGNTKVYKSLLAKFYIRYADKMDVIKDLIHNRRREEARREAHTLKGLSGNLGATELYNSVADLEGALKRENYEEITELLEPCCAALAKTLKILSPLVAETGEPYKETEWRPEDFRRLEILFDNLIQLLRDDDTEACRVAEELAEQITGVEGDDFKKAREYISEYDFEKALEYLERLKKSMNYQYSGDFI